MYNSNQIKEDFEFLFHIFHIYSHVLIIIVSKNRVYYSLAATLPNLSGTPSSPPCNRASASILNISSCT